MHLCNLIANFASFETHEILNQITKHTVSSTEPGELNQIQASASNTLKYRRKHTNWSFKQKKKIYSTNYGIPV